MIQLVYVSSATVPFSKADLLGLLEKSRVNNERDGLSGILLYKDGNFMQVLEGEEVAVMTTYDRISKDSRHGGILTLLTRTLEQPDFRDWSMAFRDLADPELAALPGYNEFMNLPLIDSTFVSDQPKAMRLLSIFRAQMR